jgi:AraC family transcriptional regulator
MYPVEIKTIPAANAIGVAHIGAYMQIGKAFEALYGWLGTNGYVEAVTRSIGLFFDDTAEVPEDKLRSMACVVLNEDIPIADPLTRVEIAGGQYAVLRHTGPYAELKSAYDWLYGVWLVGSEFDAADAPSFEEYMNDPSETAPSDLITDIYLPLRRVSVVTQAS